MKTKRVPWISLVPLGILAFASMAVASDGPGDETAERILKSIGAKYAQREKNDQFYRFKSRVAHSVGDGSFVAQTVVERLSRMRWRRQVVFEGYSEIEMVKDDSLWRKRSHEWTPPSVREMLNAVVLGPRIERLSEGHVGKLKKKNLAGRPVLCMKVRAEVSDAWICLEEGTRHLVEIGHEGLRFSFGATRELDEENWYPEEIFVTGMGRARIHATLVAADLTPSATADEWEVSEGSSEWPWCADLKGPQSLSGRLRHRAFLVVDDQGEPEQIKVFGNMKEEARFRAEEQIRRTRFQPATCGGRPVRWEFVSHGLP